jgi:hypothetical protein
MQAENTEHLTAIEEGKARIKDLERLIARQKDSADQADYRERELKNKLELQEILTTKKIKEIKLL